MIYFDKKEALKQHITTLRAQNKTIGFVPTMGALHDGHLSLIEKAQSENDVFVVSIFVNPTQFDNPEDLLKYPKTLEKDLAMLENFENGIVFAPSIEEIYEKEVKASVFDFDGLDLEMEGKFRSGHFDGVATIVKALFLLVNPAKAYFGEKDFQQLQIIKKMVSIEALPVEIIGCPIHRETDGLAMSSRNTRLSIQERKAAPMIYKVISTAKEKFKTEEIEKIINWVEDQFKKNKYLGLEYFLIADEKSLKPSNQKENNKDYRAFIAVYAGNIRLIDNIKLSHK